MIRRSLPVFLPLLLPGLRVLGLLALGLLAPAAAGAQDLPVATSKVEHAPAARSNDGRIAVTRSDGSTGFTKAPDRKEIRKLVGYMQDGMRRADRADRADRQKSTRRVIRRIWIRR